MNRTIATLCAAAAIAASASVDAAGPPLRLADSFRRLEAPQTGRRAVQLTSGAGLCYPLYFYVPSITADARYVVYHKAWDGQLQLFRLELATGRSVQLTHARCPDTRWRPWQMEQDRGVLDHRSVLNVPRGLAVYFDGKEARAVNLQTLADELLFELPTGREATGQNGCTPDGKWLAYIHAPQGSEHGKPCQGAVVAAYNFATRENRTLCTIDAPIDHVTAYDNEHFVFSHPVDHTGIMMTDLASGRWTRLRQGDPGVEGHVIHAPMTARGIAYEVPDAKHGGLYDPLTRRRFEFKIPQHFGWVHTGRDPEGRLWFYENADDFNHPTVHDLWAVVRIDRSGNDKWLRLVGNWPTYGTGQRAHFHPQLTPDRKWLLMTGGDPASRSNHLFLLDVSDLKDTEGIGPELLSRTGQNDLTK